MPDDVNFVDLAALARITPDTVVERFGGMINSSFFDASNILAMLKQKGLIDFVTSFPGQSAITVTDVGKKLLADAAEGAKGEFDMLDMTLLTQLANGKRTIQDLSGAVNIRSKDLAMHLYKLGQQLYLSYEFRNGNITISLSEKGFLQSKSGMPQSAAQQAAAMPAAGATTPAAGTEAMLPQQPMPNAAIQGQVAGPATTPDGKPMPNVDINQLEANIKKAKNRRILYIVVLVAIIAVIVIALMLMR